MILNKLIEYFAYIFGNREFFFKYGKKFLRNFKEILNIDLKNVLENFNVEEIIDEKFGRWQENFLNKLR